MEKNTLHEFLKEWKTTEEIGHVLKVKGRTRSFLRKFKNILEHRICDKTIIMFGVKNTQRVTEWRLKQA